MPLLAIDHIQLAMPAGQEAAARRFYQDLLGLAETPKPPALAKRGGCWFEQGSVRVHLGVEAEFRPARKAHPAFLVDDLASLIQRLREAGVGAIEDKALPGYERCYVADPFGNRIELMQRL
ncbi:glyoxalase [Labrys miyagiensis]|uniref:Glyoxalase n=1 Tax=Labrys miyagiensis TaxID=346912 RepID=A0ABQ6CAW6_9HYPH|nr:VOC family protein [Labrys miyagiensis]GLS17522.1 glyoxalase [Labrys miyagiensis]